jgi:hypothetical protein
LKLVVSGQHAPSHGLKTDKKAAALKTPTESSLPPIAINFAGTDLKQWSLPALIRNNCPLAQNSLTQLWAV